jgi:hypothetical protein
MRSWPLLLALLCLGSAGCTVALTKAQRGQLRSVSIDPNIEMPVPKAPHQGFYVTENPGDDLRETMKARGIDPVEILRSAFTEQVRQVRGLPPLQEDRGDAVFHLKVLVYGMESSGSVRPIKILINDYPLKPVLSVNASLTLPDGKVIWTGRGHVTNMSGKLTSHYLSEILKDVELVRDELEKATRIVAKELVESLEEAQ